MVHEAFDAVQSDPPIWVALHRQGGSLNEHASKSRQKSLMSSRKIKLERARLKERINAIVSTTQQSNIKINAFLQLSFKARCAKYAQAATENI